MRFRRIPASIPAIDGIVRTALAGSTWIVALLLVLGLAWSGCASDREDAGNETPELTSIHWAPIESADGYTVRVWSGYTLLFEQISSDTTLVLTPNLRSTLAAFDSVTVELRGWRAADPERPVEVRRWRLLPAS